MRPKPLIPILTVIAKNLAPHASGTDNGNIKVCRLTRQSGGAPLATSPARRAREPRATKAAIAMRRRIRATNRQSRHTSRKSKAVAAGNVAGGCSLGEMFGVRHGPRHLKDVAAHVGQAKWVCSKRADGGVPPEL